MGLGNRRGARLATLGTLLAVTALPAYANDPTPPPPASVTQVSHSLEQLRAEAAALQAEFAKATIAYTNALKASQAAEAAAKRAEAAAAVAKAKAVQERHRLGLLTVQAYQLGLPTTIGTESMLWSLAPIAENLQEIADRQAAIIQAGSAQVSQYQTAVAAAAVADKASRDAATKRAVADQAAAKARQLSQAVAKKAADGAAAMEDQVAELANASELADQLQDTRNQQALSRWKTYLTELTVAKVKAPAASAISNPAKLPAGLRPLIKSGKAVPGAAAVVDDTRVVRVLPAETIRAVNRAFSLVGKPYGAGATGPKRYGCLATARAAWTPYTTLPDLVGKVYADYQAVPVGLIQPGDVLVMGSKSIGLFHIGIALDTGEMIAADETKGSVVVTSVPDNLYAALRPTLGKPHRPQNAPVATSKAQALRCGATPTYDGGSDSWTWPLADGTYEIGTPFGQSGDLWSSGFHTGQDFPAAIGTPVRAATAGTVSIEHPAWAGNLVRIDHGDGLETLYAHLNEIDVSDGASVSAGQRIGTVGDKGNTTGPHLHFEVRLGGDPVNPMPFLATGTASTGWGGYSNGVIPARKLCAVGTSGHKLRCDAAAAYLQLASAYRAHFGKRLCITDSYRSYSAQVDLYARKPSLAALPGTSNHGWGVAVDLCGGIEHYGTVQYKWMKTHAAAFGWVHPAWADQGRSREEPWHWEFGKPPTA
ncbi:murein DD-endopeptidase MepM/ murein hydrolase activator NlpD [Kribbella antiqua]|uniref:Murein DD-endopeptidase MepM/ murein hydrolase activator NlpD n=1 Tax=Kribbella antiqua TaxID=2512217 RepID=A0A4R2J2C4_9ACTN|nr:murein DD-endopeptidase MepM/ murein hydrolase activator NlpD [Kribbella antiqua]